MLDRRYHALRALLSSGLVRRVAEGQQDPAEVSTSLRIVLQLEGIKTEIGAGELARR